MHQTALTNALLGDGVGETYATEAEGSDASADYFVSFRSDYHGTTYQPALQAVISQSLAGRTGMLELLPLSIAELKGAGVAVTRDIENSGKLDLYEIKAGQTFHDEMADNLRSIQRLLPAEIGNVTVVYAGRTVSAFGGIPVVDFSSCFRRGNMI